MGAGWKRGLMLLGLAAVLSARAEVPLGPLGGKGDPIQDTLFLQVNSLTTTAPGYLAGLRAGDMIYGAFGRPFGTTRSSYYGYSGAVQDFGLAIERAEAGDGQLPLLVLRSGLGGTNITVTLPAAGGFGPPTRWAVPSSTPSSTGPAARSTRSSRPAATRATTRASSG
jgi:hypothetical protein